jgi:hypothetical protein
LHFIEVRTPEPYDRDKLEDQFNGFLDDNQQSEAKRKRKFYGWKFKVSANNKILNLQRSNF